MQFDTEAQSVALANKTPFGLAAYFYARDIDRIWRVSAALKSGMVGINDGAISSATAPLVGWIKRALAAKGRATVWRSTSNSSIFALV